MSANSTRTSWTADNGDGTYTNPLFFEEFSDPDVIRVGDDYYLAGTSMHVMPGIPILHSRDLVNWTLASYVYDRIALSPGFHLADGKEVYGQGTWAPTLRYHAGVFYVLTNVNGHRTQVFRATDPRGPWTRNELNVSFHDLSILFDEDDRVYAIHGHQEIHQVELNSALTEVIPDTHRIIIPEGSGMGEGVHFYKFRGRYYILSSVWDPVCYMVGARSDRPEGPYEITTLSADESFGISMGWRIAGNGRIPPPFKKVPPHPTRLSRIPLHQGGLVETSSGEWWALSMMDHNGVGRVTALSPVTWHEGWPYFGLPGNLGRTPRTWAKPDTGHTSPRAPLFTRDDAFAGPALNPVWQWNHHPDDSRWSLTERPGHLRLHSLPATDFWWARNTLTQRTVGPEAVATVELDPSGLRPGDTAGLGLLGYPHAWIGIVRTADGSLIVRFHDQDGERNEDHPCPAGPVRLRIHADHDTDLARFSFSSTAPDATFTEIGGEPWIMIWQAKTFQGLRYSLFHYNTTGAPGGHADFTRFTLDEPRAQGRSRPIPYGRTVTFRCLADGSLLGVRNGVLESVAADGPHAADATVRFRIDDCGRGRVALFSERYQAYLGVGPLGLAGDVRIRRGLTLPGPAEHFQWIDQLRDDVTLLSLATHRYLKAAPEDVGPVSAHCPGPRPDRADGATFRWSALS